MKHHKKKKNHKIHKKKMMIKKKIKIRILKIKKKILQNNHQKENYLIKKLNNKEILYKFIEKLNHKMKTILY